MAMNGATSLTTPRDDIKGTFGKGILEFEPSVLEWLRPLRTTKTKGVLDVLPPQSLMDRPADVKRNRDGSYKFTESEREEITFRLASYGLNHAYDDEEAADYEDDYNYKVAIGKMLYSRVMRAQETRGIALVNTTTFATGTRGHSSSNVWSTPASGDPAADAKKARIGMYDLAGIQPNAAVMGWRNVWDAWQCDAVWKNLKYTQGVSATPNLEILAAAMDLKKIIIWGGKYNTKQEGITPVLGEMSNTDHVFFCRVAETDSPDEPCIGRTLYHDGYGGLVSVKEIRNENNDNDVQRVYQKVQEKIFWNNLGWLMVNAD